jgi:fatty-acyl-CoA synthase
MADWLRVSFSDTGTEYFIDKRLDTSLSAKIILAAVDNFHTDRSSGKPIYCMDFLYQSDVNIRDFLMRE